MFFCGLSWLPDQLTDTKENLRLKKHTSLNHLQQAGKPRESNIILLHTVLFSFYTESLVNLRRELLFVSFFFPLTHFTPTHLERISNWHTNQLTHDSFSSLTYLWVTAKAHSSKVHVTSCVELSPTIRADQSHALIWKLDSKTLEQKWPDQSDLGNSKYDRLKTAANKL